MPPRRRQTSSALDMVTDDCQWMRVAFEQRKMQPGDNCFREAFIRRREWETIMKDDRLDTTLRRLGMSEPQRRKITKSEDRRDVFLKSLSTLVRLQYHQMFKDVFAFLDQPEHEHLKTMPLPDKVVHAIWPGGSPVAVSFSREQHFFCPQTLPLYNPDSLPDAPQEFPNDIRLAFKHRRLLGSGASGKVYLITVAEGYATIDDKFRTQSDHDFAVKVYNDLLSFDLEADMLTRLAKYHRKHRHLTTVKGAYLQSGKAHVVLPYFKYGDLHSFLTYWATEEPDGSSLTETNTTRDFVERFWKKSTDRIGPMLEQYHLVLDALHHLHKFDQNDQIVVHGDIKPQNILIGVHQNSVFLTVADFGLSEHFVKHTKLLHNTGNNNSAGSSDESSPLVNPGPRSGSYRSPEELQMPPKLSSQSDVWSAICIFLELLTLFLGDHQAVRAFAEQRRQDSPRRTPNDGFCLHLDGEDGHAGSGDRAVPFVRESVERHLQSLDAKYTKNAAWVQCAIKLVRRVLVFNSSNIKDRPKSGEVHRMLGRVLHHFKNAHQSCTCPEHANLPNYRFPPLSPPRQPATARPAPIATRTAPTTEPQWTPPAFPPREPPSPHPTLRRDSLQPWNEHHETGSFHLVSGYPKAKDACISSKSAVATWLYENGHLRFVKLKITPSDVKPGTLQFHDLGKPGDLWAWKAIECAGDYMAVWKRKKHGLVSEAHLFTVLETGKLQEIPVPHANNHFNAMRVGSNGHFVYCKERSLSVLFRGARDARGGLLTLDLPSTYTTSRDARFRDARFNSDGDKLYAWSCANLNTECLSVWTFSDPSVEPTRQDFFYKADHNRNPDISLMPLNTRLGCVVQRVDGNTCNCFLAFPCNRIHTHDRKHDKFFGTSSFKAVVLRDASLVRLVTGQAAKVVTSDLTSDHPFDEPTELFKLKKKPDSEAVLAVIEHELQLLGFVVHMNGEVEVARFVG